MVFTAIQSLIEDPMRAVLVGVGIVIPITLLVHYSSHKRKEGSVRHPHRLSTTLPVLGNLLDFIKNAEIIHDWTSSLCEKYKGEPFCLVKLGQPMDTTVYTPQGVEDMLKLQFDNLPKGPTQQENFRDLLGHGIFATDGEKWVHQRKTASNLFTARGLRDTMTESMRRYAVVLERILVNARDTQQPIDVFKLMNKFTIEAFAKMAFGVDMNCLESDDEHPFQSAFDSAQRAVLLRFLRPAWFWKLQRWLSVGAEGQLKQDMAVIDKTVMDIAAQSLAHRQAGQNQVKSGDIVSLFLDHFDESSGEKFDPKYLRDIVVNFLIAGRDTTAQAMSWCLLNLSRNPPIVAKIRAEIAKHVPDFANGTRTKPLSMEEVQHLVYLDAVLKETLRLHPSVPFLPKFVMKDTLLSDGTLLPAGSTASIPVYAMGRMEFIWGPDAKQFKPERWIDPATGKLRNESAFKFVSFNAGPRICLGMNLAMLEMKIVMATVLTRFNIEFLDSESITYDLSLTLAVKGEMLARVTSA